MLPNRSGFFWGMNIESGSTITKPKQDHIRTVGLIYVSCQVIPSGSAVTREPTEEEKERLAHIRETDVILRPSAPIQMEEEAKRKEREKEANALINHYAQVMSAGVSALVERAFFQQSVPPSWGTLTKDELTKMIAGSLRLYEEEKDKRAKTLPNRLKSAAKWIIACVVSAVVGFYVLHLLGLG